MEINFTRNQYIQLLKCTAIATWIAEKGYDNGAKGETFERYYYDMMSISDHIESFAKEMKAEEFVDYESIIHNDFMLMIADIIHDYETAVYGDRLVL